MIQPIFIDDLVEGLVKGMERGEIGEAYLLAGPQAVQIKTFFRFYADMVGVRWIPSVPKFLAGLSAGMLEGLARLTRKPPLFTRDNLIFTTMNVSYSGEKAARELGFRAQTSLEDGMRRTKNWFQEEGLLKG
jgi:nucleoside-diphosphate-sugar epimerase